MNGLQWLDAGPAVQPDEPDEHYCDWCSNADTQMAAPDGAPREWLMSIDDGRLDFQCPRDAECVGSPNWWFDGSDLMHTVTPLKVTVKVIEPRYHVHYDQNGCDCGVDLVIAAPEKEPTS